MKIAFVSNVFPPHVRGGYELGAREIIRSVARRGHDVVVLTSASTGSLNRGEAEMEIPVEAIFAPVFAFEADLADLLADSPAWCRERTDALGGFHVANMIALDHALRRFGPDVVWMFNPVGLGTVGILEAPLCHAARRVVHLMDDIDHYARGNRRALSWEARWRRIKQSWGAISCSSITRRANETMGCYGGHAVIPNGIRFDDWAPPSSGAKRSEVFRFVYFGQVDAPKGIMELVRAFARVRKLRPGNRATLDIIGRGSRQFEESLHGLISHLGVAQEVSLLGFRSHRELRELLPAYDAAAMLLRSGEPFGYAPLEAVAAGLPVIFSADIGFAEFMPARYPLLVPDRNDVEQLAGRMAECLDRRDYIAEMAGAWRDTMLARCDLERSVVPEYLEFVESLPVSSAACSLDAILSPVRTCDDHESWQLSQ